MTTDKSIEKGMKLNMIRVKELKEIITLFNDNDLFWIENGIIFIKCGDKDSESYGEIITLKRCLELYGVNEVKQ